MKQKRKIWVLSYVLIALLSILLLSSCSKKSNFEITFINVEHGDSALVECDGHYMLIDCGDKSHGGIVMDEIKKETNGVNKLDILAISHFDRDHCGGLPEVLSRVKADLAIGNADPISDEAIRAVGDDEEESEDANTNRHYMYGIANALSQSKVDFKVPTLGTTYNLGSAVIEVIDVSSKQRNDSLVLLVTYRDTKFMFTGDIEDNAQKRIYEKYINAEGNDKGYKIDLMKLPHHGAYNGTLPVFIRTFMPQYVIISASGKNKHPHPDTLKMLTNKKSGLHPKIYRTDLDGNITVHSDGKKLSVTTSPKT